MRESAKKRHYYKKRYFRKNRITIEQYKSISKKNKENKEICNT